MTIWYSECYFGRSVVSGLNVRVQYFVLETAGAKINNFDSCFLRFNEENVLWLKITVDQLLLAKELQGVKYLNREFSYNIWVNSQVVVAFNELVQVLIKQLKDDALSKLSSTWCFRKTKKSLIFTIPDTP